MRCFYSNLIDRSANVSGLFIFEGEFDSGSGVQGESSLRGLASLVLGAGSEFWTTSKIGSVSEDLNYEPRVLKGYKRFRFALEKRYEIRSDDTILEASLIIDPVPTLEFYDLNSKRVKRVFRGFLDVSYHDQHGDYVGVSCEQASYPASLETPSRSDSNLW